MKANSTETIKCPTCQGAGVPDILIENYTCVVCFGAGTLTLEQAVTRLAEKMVDCTCNCHEYPEEIHPINPDCKGVNCTGKVPLLPMLRKQGCDYCNSYGYTLDNISYPTETKAICIVCEGRSWLPDTSFEAMLEAITSLGYAPRFRHNSYGWLVTLYVSIPLSQIPWGEGEYASTPSLALAAALVEAVKEKA